jgi:hypothetical protein
MRRRYGDGLNSGDLLERLEGDGGDMVERESDFAA